MKRQSREQVFEWGTETEVRVGVKKKRGCKSRGIRRVGDVKIDKKNGGDGRRTSTPNRKGETKPRCHMETRQDKLH